jgi:hypothetical protein
LEAPTLERSMRPVYQVHDLISIPGDVPALEVERGDEGIIRELLLRNDDVTALVEITYSTGQRRGWIFVEIMPEEKVVCYTLED